MNTWKGDILSRTIDTKYLGKIEIEKKQIIQFPFGLPGFIEEEEFVILDIPGNEAFQTLQSVATPSLAFIVTNPYQFYLDYTFKLDEQILESLAIESEEDVVVFSIVTLKSPFKTSTLNLKAPIIINSTEKQGKQYILNKDDYSTKAPIVSPNMLKVEGES